MDLTKETQIQNATAKSEHRDLNTHGAKAVVNVDPLTGGLAGGGGMPAWDSFTVSAATTRDTFNFFLDGDPTHRITIDYADSTKVQMTGGAVVRF